MRTSSIIPEDAQLQFWAVVEQCIREFHGPCTSSAFKKMNQLKLKLEKRPIEEFELFFHSEPFDVACSLADQPLRVEDYLDRYLAIRDVDYPLTS